MINGRIDAALAAFHGKPNRIYLGDVEYAALRSLKLPYMVPARPPEFKAFYRGIPITKLPVHSHFSVAQNDPA